MSYQDITSHLKEMYDFDVSPATLNAVTDKLLHLIAGVFWVIFCWENTVALDIAFRG